MFLIRAKSARHTWSSEAGVGIGENTGVGLVRTGVVGMLDAMVEAELEATGAETEPEASPARKGNMAATSSVAGSVAVGGVDT